MWKFTGISVKYKTQIGTNDHKLSKILFTQTDRLIMNYALWIMNYYRPQICTDFKDFSFCLNCKTYHTSQLSPLSSQLWCRPQILTDFKDLNNWRVKIENEKSEQICENLWANLEHWIFGAASTERSLLQLCRVVTKIMDWKDITWNRQLRYLSGQQ